MVDLEFAKLEFEFVTEEIKRVKKQLETENRIKVFKKSYEYLNALEIDKEKLIKVLGL